MRSREEFENLINGYLVYGTNRFEIFDDIGKRMEFLTLITDYYRSYVYPDKPLESYEVPLMETAVKCIRYFDKNKGVFLHLLNGEMKKALRRARAEEKKEQLRRGLKLPYSAEKAVQKITAYAMNRNLDIYDADVQKRIADVFGLSLPDIKYLIFLNYDTVAVSGTVENDDGDETDLFDFIAAKEMNAEEKLEEESRINELIERIENVFISVQERQKSVLSMVLTAEILKAFKYDAERVVKVLDGKELFCREIVDGYLRSGELPTRKKIGEACGVSAQSLSRKYSNFLGKLK